MPATVTAPAKTALQQKFADAASVINASLVERHEEVELALTGLLAGEHVLFVGIPGTAKSMVLDAIVKWCGSADNTFSELLGKFTTPENVFGPISLTGMKKDDYRRVTVGYLPASHFAFLDEIFKASSAILNTMLKVLNERQFRNGSQGVVKCPLRFCVAASNEWPGGEGQDSLEALFDRFLLRKKVNPISTSDGLQRLLFSPNLTPEFSDTLSIDELDEARLEVLALPWTNEAMAAMVEMLHKLKSEGIHIGDRRKRKSINVARAYAWLLGSSKVEVEHLAILAHSLWNDPHEQADKAAATIGQIANPLGHSIKSKLLEAHQIYSACNITDHADAVTAVAKLSVTQKELRNMKDHPTLEAAKEEVAKLIRDIKLANAA